MEKYSEDWFMDYAEHALRVIELEQEWLEMRYRHLYGVELRGRHDVQWTKDEHGRFTGSVSSGGGSAGGGKSVDNAAKNDIIKESSDKPITEITDSAVERVPLVKISGYSDEQCAVIQQQHQELLKYARDNNGSNEVAFVFDSAFQIRKEFRGSDDTIDFGGAFYGSDLFVMHNHPRNSSYSFNDIVEFFANDKIKTLTIVKNNGRIETLTKLKQYDRLKILKELQQTDHSIKKSTTKGEYRDAQYRKFVDKVLAKHQKGGLVEWTK